MLILLTNDDGVYADGLQILRRELEERGFELAIVAPERERSASGHAITLHKPVYVHRLQLDGTRVPAWSVSGTPADCAKLGVLALLERRPDLVVSGINRGPNLGMDVLYSGTVSAAFEAAILGLPAVAVSLGTFEDADYAPAARFTGALMEQIARRSLPPGVLLNVNVPPLPEEEMAGVAVTRLGVRYYTDVFHPRQDPRGRTYYWLAGEVVPGREGPDTDVGALEQNLVSITPLHLRLTDQAALEGLRAWIPDLERALDRRLGG